MTTVTVLNHRDLFTVAEYQYTRFVFGTPIGYAAQYNETPRHGAGDPYAFADCAVLSSTPLPRPIIAAALAFGALITTPAYPGVYRIERDHNRNVKLTKLEPQAAMEALYYAAQDAAFALQAEALAAVAGLPA